MDDIKIFTRNKKELGTLIHAVRIYIEMEFGREKYIILVLKSSKQHPTDGMELPNQEKLERSEERKRTNSWEYWKLTIK